MRRRNEKSNGCTFSFYIWLRCSFGQKENCLTEEVYLDQVTFKKLQLDIQLKFNFAHKVLTRAKYCYFFMCKPGKVLSCSPGSQLMKITVLFLVIFCSNENTLVTRGKSCIRRRTVRCKPHIQLGGRTCDRRWEGASTKLANQRCGGRVTIVHTYIVCGRFGSKSVEQKFNHCIRSQTPSTIHIVIVCRAYS